MATKVSLNVVNVHPFLLATDADRVKARVNLDGNTTSTLEDIAFTEFRGLTITREQRERIHDTDFRIQQSSQVIEQHLERRLSQLFVQAVVCYRTKYEFREGHVLHQGQNATPISSVVFQAAHCATVPCLYAKSPDTNREIVYLYRSPFYDESNATIDVVKAVNDADRAIDEKYSDSLLRDKTIELLNRAARGEITPEQASKDFVHILINEIDKALERSGESEEVKAVLELYREKAELLWSYVDQPEHIDRWLNVDMDDPMVEVTAATIDHLKESTPTSRAEVLTLIKKKVDELPPIIRRVQHQMYNEARAPNHFYDLYHYNVLRHFTGVHLAILEEALGLRLADLQAKVVGFKKIGKTNSVLTQNMAKIESLAREVSVFTGYLQGQSIQNLPIEGLSPQKKVCLRPDVYRLRYHIIRVDQEVQSAIKSKIESALQAIKQNSGSKPYLDLFFYQSLFNHAGSDSMRIIFSKMLNISRIEQGLRIGEIKVNQAAHKTLEDHASLISQISGQIQQTSIEPSLERKQWLRARIQTVYNQMKSAKDSKSLDILFYKRLFIQAQTPQAKALVSELTSQTEEGINQRVINLSKVTAAETAINENTAHIEDAVRTAITEIARLNIETAHFRRRLMVELRLSHGMSQNYFKAFYKKTYPIYPMSDGTMSNLENGLKRITPEIIQQVSEIFGVSQSLFYPSHFAQR
ncbi:MAG: helix-turn-helix transcriptional regulator [Chlamydiae bacterium]|nr:helix-turn-helix transcriptional regulator [Chlamydiota bacterium]